MLQAHARVGGTGNPFTVSRRGVAYSVRADACVFDDPKDGLAASAPTGACTPAAAAIAGTAAEVNPDDFRRVSLDISWTRDGHTTHLTQSALMVNPAGGLGPRIISLTDPSATGQTSAGTSLDFAATSTTAQSVRWLVDDALGSNGDLAGPSTSWNFTWNFGTFGVGSFVYDGVYLVTAQAFDPRGVPGDTKVSSILLNRAAPIQPTGFDGGYNQAFDVVDLRWNRNPERDIVGYRVYRGATGNDLVCDVPVDRPVLHGHQRGEPDDDVSPLRGRQARSQQPERRQPPTCARAPRRPRSSFPPPRRSPRRRLPSTCRRPSRTTFRRFPGTSPPIPPARRSASIASIATWIPARTRRPGSRGATTPRRTPTLLRRSRPGRHDAAQVLRDGRGRGLQRVRALRVRDLAALLAMTSPVPDRQAGFTLIEVLLVCVISLVVLGATLTAFAALMRGQSQSTRQADETENTRLAMEHAVRQLRNLANPTATSTSTIDTASDYDFIFQTSDPTKTWVRYCLQTSGASGGVAVSPARGLAVGDGEHRGRGHGNHARDLLGLGGRMDQTPPRRRSRDQSHRRRRPQHLHVLLLVAAAPTCPASSAEYPKLTTVALDLFSDIDPARRPLEKRLSSAVFLRNQNEVPTAAFTQRQVSSRRVLLNASASGDPEGRTLQYFWFKNSARRPGRAQRLHHAPHQQGGRGHHLHARLPDRRRHGERGQLEALLARGARPRLPLFDLRPNQRGDSLMRDRLRDDEGWVLVTAMLVLALMLAMGIAALGMADNGTQDTRQQRERESALALDEGVLYAQGFVLASNWPSAAGSLSGLLHAGRPADQRRVPEQADAVEGAGRSVRQLPGRRPCG